MKVTIEEKCQLDSNGPYTMKLWCMTYLHLCDYIMLSSFFPLSLSLSLFVVVIFFMCCCRRCCCCCCCRCCCCRCCCCSELLSGLRCEAGPTWRSFFRSWKSLWAFNHGWCSTSMLIWHQLVYIYCPVFIYVFIMYCASAAGLICDCVNFHMLL